MTIDFYNPKTLKADTHEKAFNSQILKNISVTAPYFALRNLRQTGEFIYADFKVELSDPDELMPISAAEVGRHMAIMGSVVMSDSNPLKERHYYLATDAIIIRRSDRELNNPNVTGRIKMESFNRKSGTASGSLFDSEMNALFDVEIKYMVLHHNIFERMFAQYKSETFEGLEVNPYKENIEFMNIELGIQNCFGSIGTITARHCSGHFKNYPALPVARMGSAMGKIGGVHFKFLNPGINKRYTIARAELHASQLVFVGEEVKFRTEIFDPNPGKGMIIKVIAYTNKIASVAESLLHYYY
jgi:hypothetical protein